MAGAIIRKDGEGWSTSTSLFLFCVDLALRGLPPEDGALRTLLQSVQRDDAVRILSFKGTGGLQSVFTAALRAECKRLEGLEGTPQRDPDFRPGALGEALAVLKFLEDR